MHGMLIDDIYRAGALHYQICLQDLPNDRVILRKLTVHKIYQFGRRPQYLLVLLAVGVRTLAQIQNCPCYHGGGNLKSIRLNGLRLCGELILNLLGDVVYGCGVRFFFIRRLGNFAIQRLFSWILGNDRRFPLFISPILLIT